MKSSMYFGNPCQSSVLSTLVRTALPAATPSHDVTALPMATPSLHMKPFLPFPLDSAPLDSAPIGLLPHFSTAVLGVSGTEPGSALRCWKAGLVCRRMCMDPVQKAILSQTLGLSALAPPPPHKSKHLVSCALCQLRFNSEKQALAHFRGTRHARKLRVLEAPDAHVVTKETARKAPPAAPLPSPQGSDCRAVSPPTTGAALSGSSGTAGAEPTSDPISAVSPSGPGEAEGEGGGETEEEKARRLLYCSLCRVAVNSTSQLDAHNSGTKHKTMLEARSGGGAIKSFPRQGVKGRLASPTQLITGLQNKTFFCEICDVHVNSETQLKQHISSRRHKDRAAGKPAKPKYSPYSKPPRTGTTPQVRQPKLIPGHVTVAGVPPITLSSTPALATALFQTPSLLRPSPGPLRTAHTPVLFTPY
ncbi:zinc finger protein 385D-like [Conger conger]|uniref:zinc finger protein 385D-like n=1 Tax=Conger conger TaxID=82655 RepID=UPI002A5B11B1|nr:zinc finger protein 385D-like [Conger conger]